MGGNSDPTSSLSFLEGSTSTSELRNSDTINRGHDVAFFCIHLREGISDFLRADRFYCSRNWHLYRSLDENLQAIGCRAVSDISIILEIFSGMAYFSLVARSFSGSSFDYTIDPLAHEETKRPPYFNTFSEYICHGKRAHTNRLLCRNQCLGSLGNRKIDARYIFH